MAQKLPFQGLRGVWDVECGLAFFLYLPLYFSSSSAKEWAHPSTGSVFFFTIVDRGGSHAGLRMHRPQLAKASRAKICVSRYNNMEVQTSRKQWLQPLKISKIYMDQYGTHFLFWSNRNVPYHLWCPYELFRKYFCSEMSALNMRSIASIWSQSEFRCRKERPLSFSQNMKMATVGYPKKNGCLMGYTLALAEQKKPSNCGFSVSLSSQKTLNNSLKSRWILWFHPVRSFPVLIWDTSVSLDVSLGNLHSTWMSRESVSPAGFATK